MNKKSNLVFAVTLTAFAVLTIVLVGDGCSNKEEPSTAALSYPDITPIGETLEPVDNILVVNGKPSDQAKILRQLAETKEPDYRYADGTELRIADNDPDGKTGAYYALADRRDLFRYIKANEWEFLSSGPMPDYDRYPEIKPDTWKALGVDSRTDEELIRDLLGWQDAEIKIVHQDELVFASTHAQGHLVLLQKEDHGSSRDWREIGRDGQLVRDNPYMYPDISDQTWAALGLK